MSRTSPPLVIDARPRGESGLLASEQVLGRPVLDHLVELAESVDGGTIAIHARQEEHERLAELLAARPSQRYRLALGPPPENAAILRADRFYDSAKLKRALRRGIDVESAVIWRIDGVHAIQVASDEVIRRRTYQPLGRFWATRPALALSRALVATRIRPNHLTIAAGLLMLGSAACVAFARGFWLGQIIPAIAMALALVFDTADGHLARLQGTASEFGRWLDASFDELGDMALHGGIAWAAYLHTQNPILLVTGMIYGMSKYLFAFGLQSGASNLPAANNTRESQPTGLRKIAHIVGHADIRWHLWIALALLGRLDLALGFYTIYFMARCVGGVMRKVGAYAA